MTFDEWWIEYRGFKDPYDGAVRLAWEESRKPAVALLKRSLEKLNYLDGHVDELCDEITDWINENDDHEHD